ncbi:sodium-dependent transporter [Butyricicoccus sp. Marseille-Q5471]|uniref:sodium-dependent transporter n=1 Tax=Butyricicoccus sp. Marseille-Q5471 TaxID=3039493 RepID=UPI0024BD2010|nr:sodium-dependent transporter [Butyricicoccus sp. Marseille-Q5471]
MQREKLGSRLGFILLSAGCAIGIGNVWKFPYMAGQYGGGAFVLFYIFFLLVLGLPIMTMEFAVGRASQKSPVMSYQALEKPGQKWHIHGYLCMIGNYLLMMFYTTVAGWMLHYFYLTASGRFAGATSETVANMFTEMLGQPLVMGGWMVLVVIVGFGVCSMGLQNGLERVTKVMMIALLAIMVVLAVNSVTMEGAAEGLSFYLKPDFARMQEIGIGATIVGAMNQAFFTLSLGIGAMAIFGSYIGKDRALLGEAVHVAVLDTFVAIVAGLIIFPACFSFNVAADSGPSLIFITLPNIFNHMAWGRLWGSLFFVFMAFAAFSTVLAVFENIISCGMDLTGASRKKVAGVNIILMILLSLPCVLGYNLWSGFMPFGDGSAVLDLEDFLVSNLWLPLGSLIYLLFCTSRYGWGWKNFKDEANQGRGLKVKDGMRIYVTYILPIVVLIIFALGIKDKFF